MIPNKFAYFSHGSTYRTNKEGENISDNSIVFVEDDQSIATRGKIFGVRGVYPGTCTTAAGTAAKVATTSPLFPLDSSGKPLPGTTIAVKFSNTNSYKTAGTTMTLNVNSTGAYPIYYNNAEVVSTTSANTIACGYKNRYTYYIFNGTQWVWLSYGNDANTTYSNVALGQGYAIQDNESESDTVTATLSSYALTTGGIVVVKFIFDVPCVSGPTLNVNAKGAKAIYHNGSPLEPGIIRSGDLATFIYSTNYYLISLDRDFNDPVSVGTLNTNNSTAQTVSSSESFSGTINLHKVSKTGSYNDLLNKPTIPTIPDYKTLDGVSLVGSTGDVDKIVFGKLNTNGSFTRYEKVGNEWAIVNVPTNPTARILYVDVFTELSYYYDTVVSQYKLIGPNPDLSGFLTSETPLSMGATTGSGNAVTDITVSGHQITLNKATTFLTEHQSLASLADGIWYDSTNKRIYLKHGTGNLSGTYSYIDATDFIKDGMVDNVVVETPSTGTNAGVECLVITFNTFNNTSTHEKIELPISRIFNAANYYTKTEIDTTLGDYPTWNELNEELEAYPEKDEHTGRISYENLPFMILDGINHTPPQYITQSLSGKVIHYNTQKIREYYTESGNGGPQTLTACTEIDPSPGVIYYDKTTEKFYKWDSTNGMVAIFGKADWNATSGSIGEILNKPTIPTVGTLNTDNSTAQTVSSSESFSGSISLHKVSKTGSYNDLLNKPEIPEDTHQIVILVGLQETPLVFQDWDGNSLTHEQVAEIFSDPSKTVILYDTSSDVTYQYCGLFEQYYFNFIAPYSGGIFYVRLEVSNPSTGIITVREGGTVDYVPDTRKINNKRLSADITLAASDVGALPANTHIPVDPVQSNWNETDNTSLAYIQNKPTIVQSVSINGGSAISPTNGNVNLSGIVTGIYSENQGLAPGNDGIITLPEKVIYGSLENGSFYSASYDIITQEWTLSDTTTAGMIGKIYIDLYTNPTIAYVWDGTGFNELSPSLSGFATESYVDSAINALPTPMVFQGTIGTGGTSTIVPSSPTEGDTYKIISGGQSLTFSGITAGTIKVGDTVIYKNSTVGWVLIPSGDEPSGTVTSVGMTVPTGLSVSSSPITSSGTFNITYAAGYSIPTTAKQASWDQKQNAIEIIDLT